ncbi:MAG: orotidine-5'-phosphate decarboxylase, partial [Clostridia bacterium]|nr:orotidine-5'-phosphate decarboxylase [Clostridia bacterium]
NDIGSTAEAYAAAYFGEGAGFPADMITVNGYLGSDGVEPFLRYCPGNGVFVLVKTSNPSSGELQDKTIDGKPVYEIMGEMTAQWGAEYMGESGYSAVGAVVGATYPAQGASLRKLLPHTFFLVPGYGAQGATAADLAGCFDKNGGGAVVNASRSILCAWQKAGTQDFVQAAVDEAVAMKKALREVLHG